MDSNTQEKLKFKNWEMFEFWLENNKDITAIANYLKSQISYKVDDELNKLLCAKARNINSYIKQKWHKHGRSAKVFMAYEKEWLAREIVFVIPRQTKTIGRPKKNYDDSKERNKRKMASKLASEQGDNTKLLIRAASLSLNKSKDTDLKFVLDQVSISPTRASTIRKCVSSNRSEATSASPEEALTLLLENQLTKKQYLNMRKFNISHGSNIYPTYDKVYESKLKCRPDGIKANERCAEVSLQNLVDHTARRILAYQEEVLCSIDVEELILILSYGFDGSTGHSLFKQKFEANQSLFVTSVIPIKVISSTGIIIWINRTSQSVRFCRPLKVEFVKETKEHILKENSNMDNQIKALKPLQYILRNGKEITVKFKLYMTLIDGKVLNVLTETKSAQQCPICHAGPKQFRTIRNFESPVFQPKADTLKYGLSPLHAWIRCFEFVLKLSYKLHLKKWQIRSSEDKIFLAERKQKLQNEFWLQMGLHIDKPKANGSGNTNDGNTARRAFSRTALLASITGLNLNFFEHFHVILIALSAEFEIDAHRFRAHCIKTAEIFFQNYEWYTMSATLHKILVHSSQVIQASLVPVGCLAENASEARNKFYKKDRTGHARKDSRAHNILDMYHRAMDSSDPYISSLCLTERINNSKKLPFSREVIGLFKMPELPPQFQLPSTSQQACASNYDSDISDDSVESLANYSIELEEEANEGTDYD